MNPLDPVTPSPDDRPSRDHVLRAILADLAVVVGETGPGLSATSQAPAPPDQIGRFTIEGRLGEGGGGVVYRAFDPVLGRVVALKLPRHDLVGDPEASQRFREEARTAALLDHPSIVPVHDSGDIEGLHYIVYAYCPGCSLSEWLKDRPDPVPSRLAARLVVALARAVQHSHDRGVLHRDLKPGNVLLQPREPDEADDLPFVPKITDFGLARRFEGAVADPGRSTTLLGTPPYMAPEQAGGRGLAVGPRTDVHGLGAILYTTLTGRPPFQGENWQETLRQVLEDDPPAPRLIRPDVERDLESICLMCLRKEPSRRYPTAKAVADDLDRFLQGVPVLARPLGASAKLGRWMRRHPAKAAALAGTLSVATVGLSGLVAVNAWLRDSNRRLTEAKVAAERNAELASRHRFGAEMGLARAAVDARRFERAQEILDGMESDGHGHPQNHLAWRLLRKSASRELEVLRGHQGWPIEFRLSHDQLSLVSVDPTGLALIWDLSRPTPRIRARLSVAVNMNPYFSPDDRAVLGVTLEHPTALIFDAKTGAVVREVHPEGPGMRFASWTGCGDTASWIFVATGPKSSPRESEKDSRVFQYVDRSLPDSPTRIVPGLPPFEDGQQAIDGQTILIRREQCLDAHEAVSGTLRWSVPSTFAPGTISGAWMLGRRFDGRELVVDWIGRKFLLRDASNGSLLHEFDIERHLFTRALLTPDGTTLAVTIGDAGRIDLIDLRTGSITTLPRPIPTPLQDIRRTVASPDSRWIALLAVEPSSHHPWVEIWDIQARRLVAEFPSQLDSEEALAFVNGGHSLLVSGRSTLRLFRIDDRPSEASTSREAPAELWDVAYSSDGQTLVVATDDATPGPTIQTRLAANGRPLLGWKGHSATVSSVALTPDGRLVTASLNAEDNLTLWDPGSARRIAGFPGIPGRLRTVDVDRHGRFIAASGDDPTVHVFDLAKQVKVHALAGHASRIHRVAFSPVQDLLASASDDRSVRLWDTTTGQPVARFAMADSAISVAFSPSGQRLALAERLGTITLLNLATGATIGKIQIEGPLTRALRFSPDGRCLASGTESGRVHLFDPETGHELLVLEGPPAKANAIAFAPDGRALAVAHHDGSLRIWLATD